MNYLQDKNGVYAITIHTNEKSKPLGDLFGIFFEDINRAADGGLYGELVENGAFEFDPRDNEDYTALTGWQKVGNTEEVDLAIEETDSVNPINPHYLKLTAGKPGCGVQNIGYNTQRITRKHILVEPLYYSASEEDATGDVILKVVNLTNKLRDMDMLVEGKDKYKQCTVYTLYGYSRDAQNVIGEPRVLEPKQFGLEVMNNRLCYEIQPEFLTLFRMSKSK